ncbi:MAG: DEAD/DEAH box helicase [Prevotellaceae bacterium]|jgi:ATP-dependent RNA helicase DeaD|nr:DEAD/DEAH box helicase [Prevotellaceae bacterium]
MITFEEMGIMPEILNAIGELGFQYPMPVQEKVIPLLLDKKQDIIALAQTGTGKTAAFGLPLIQHIDLKNKKTQTLILCPTRELCVQIADDLKDFAKYIENLKILPVYGGANIETQLSALKKGVHIIVATPGRMLDLLRRKAANFDEVKTVVLDEADEMLNMGFLESLNDILSQVPEEHNTLLFSATMPKEIVAIAQNYMVNALEITIGNRNESTNAVKHVCYTVQAKDKYYTLKRIADFHPNIYGLIFCRTRRETQEIADKLIKDGYNADALHGDLSQAQRDYVMQKFRIRNVQLLVATDVAARGLDVDDLTHVINYTLPDDVETYTHRSGRTGRAGKTGVSIAIINLREKHLIKQIEKKINKKFEDQKVPTGREICEKQLFNLINKMEKVEIDDSQIDSYLPQIYRKLEWLDKEDIIKRFVSLEFNRFLNYYRDAEDISTPQAEEKKEKGRRENRERGGNERKSRSEKKRSGKNPRAAEKGYTRMFINIGKTDGLYPNTLIELINKSSQGKNINIGKIDLMKNFSFFEIDSLYATSLIKELKNVYYKDRRVSIEIAQS